MKRKFPCLSLSRKFICLLLIWCTFFVSCSNSYQAELNGQWQLLRITYPGGAATEVKTQFYNFQHERIFSHTMLHTPDSSSISCGYIKFPQASTVIVSMDTTGLSAGNLRNVNENFLEYSGWDSYEKKFTIAFSDNIMVLTDESSIVYTFKKH